MVLMMKVIIKIDALAKVSLLGENRSRALTLGSTGRAEWQKKRKERALNGTRTQGNCPVCSIVTTGGLPPLVEKVQTARPSQSQNSTNTTDTTLQKVRGWRAAPALSNGITFEHDMAIAVGQKRGAGGQKLQTRGIERALSHLAFGWTLRDNV